MEETKENSLMFTHSRAPYDIFFSHIMHTVPRTYNKQ